MCQRDKVRCHLLSCLHSVLATDLLICVLAVALNTFNTSPLQMSGIQSLALFSLGQLDQLFCYD